MTDTTITRRHAVVKTGLSWQGASVVVQAATQVVVLAVLARLIEPGAFGLMAMAGVAIAFGQLLSEAGAAAAIVQRKDPLDGPFVGAAYTLSVGIGLVLFIGQAVLSKPLESFFGMRGLAGILVVLGAVFVFNSIARVPEAILQRELRFSALMKITLVAQILGYAVPAILLATAGFGVWALVAGTILQGILRMGLLLVVGRRGGEWVLSWAAIREVGTFGLAMTKIRFWNYVMEFGDRFIIGKRLDVEALGQYQVITQLARMPGQYLGNVLDAVFFPVMSRLQERREAMSRTYLELASSSYILMLGVGLYLAANGEIVVNIALGERWMAAVPLFQVICLGSGFRIMSRMGDVANRALGQVYAASIRKMILALVYIGAVLVAIPYGLLTVCIAVVACQLFGAVIISSLVWKGMGLRWREVRRPLGRSVLWSLALVTVNLGLVFGPLRDGLPAGAMLALSTVLHAVLGFIFLGPILRLWRDAGQPAGYSS